MRKYALWSKTRNKHTQAVTEGFLGQRYTYSTQEKADKKLATFTLVHPACAKQETENETHEICVRQETFKHISDNTIRNEINDQARKAFQKGTLLSVEYTLASEIEIGDVEAKLDISWADVKYYFVKWNILHIETFDGKSYELDMPDPHDGDDLKRPDNIVFYQMDEENQDNG